MSPKLPQPLPGGRGQQKDVEAAELGSSFGVYELRKRNKITSPRAPKRNCVTKQSEIHG